MNRIKWITSLLLALTLCVAASGCMNNRSGGGATSPAPTMGGTTVMPSVAPSQSPAQNASAAPSETGAQAFDWAKQAGNVEMLINKYSEVAASRVVVCRNTALVGVQFASAYQGEMTDRIHNMIAGEVRAADPAVQTVAVTADANDVSKVNEIADKIKAGADPQEFEQEIDSIVRNASTMS